MYYTQVKTGTLFSIIIFAIVISFIVAFFCIYEHDKAIRKLKAAARDDLELQSDAQPSGMSLREERPPSYEANGLEKQPLIAGRSEQSESVDSCELEKPGVSSC